MQTTYRKTKNEYFFHDGNFIIFSGKIQRRFCRLSEETKLSDTASSLPWQMPVGFTSYHSIGNLGTNAHYLHAFVKLPAKKINPPPLTGSIGANAS